MFSFSKVVIIKHLLISLLLFSFSVSAIHIFLVNQMQVISLIMAGITWNPEFPRWLINMLESLTNIVSLDFPSLFSSPQCSAEMGPIAQWQTSMAMPWIMVALFLIWFVAAKCYYSRKNKKADGPESH